MGADRPRRRSRRNPTLSACLTLALMALVLPATSAAKPTVTLSAQAVPIPKHLLEPTGPKWPRTGNRAGVGAELEAHFAIAGSEDQGLPAPLRRVVLYLPRGARIHTGGFASCHPKLSNWLRGRPLPCPTGAFASVPGEVQELINTSSHELGTLSTQGAVLLAGGGIGFWNYVRIGANLDNSVNAGSLTPTTGAYSYKLSESLPRRTVIGAPSLVMTTTALNYTLGAAYMKGGKLTSLVTLPKLCPAGGLPIKAELSFGDGTTPTWETTTVTAKLPCRG